MLKKKKYTRSLELVGKRKYDFDSTLEKRIYSCLCCSYGAKKAFKKLDDKLKFSSYQQWKQYVFNKYEYYCKDDLIEFSRYLNQNIRNSKPYSEYWKIMLSVLLTISLTIILDAFLNIHFKSTGLILWVVIITVMLILVMAIVVIIMQTLGPMLENNTEEYFYRDYKEIIDEMINK